MGVFGKNDGYLRFAGKNRPYNDDWGHEICLSVRGNTQTEVRRQKRSGAAKHNEAFKTMKTPKLLSEEEPVMFIIEFFDNGYVKLTKDDDDEAFFLQLFL